MVSRCETPWYGWPTPDRATKQAVIIGAGLAGCYLARALAERDWQISLIDEQPHVGARASANPQALLFPPTSNNTPDSLSLLTQLGYAYSKAVLPRWIERGVPGALHGLIKFAARERDQSLVEASGLNAEELTKLSGIQLEKDGMFFPDAGWIDLQAWCQALVEHPNIQVKLNRTMNGIEPLDAGWCVDGMTKPVLILSCGVGTAAFSQTSRLSSKAVRGQLTWIHATAQSEALRVPLCGSGHVLPALNGQHLLGATYDDKPAQTCDASSDQENLQRLRQFGTQWSGSIAGHWADARAVTADYLPYVGGVVDDEKFMHVYQGLRTDAKRWIPTASPCYPGLYVFTGFGSKGVTTIPLLASWFAEVLNGGVGTLPVALVKALSPARCLFRKMTRH
jgi:tRNA 5-methylaminomethyl-2-thiouridine biosynthesis bifunctional protein